MGKAQRLFLTIGVDFGGVSVLVVGGGAVGMRKAAVLSQHGALVTVVDPLPTPSLEAAVEAGQVCWLPERYAATQLAGRGLIIAATGDAELNRRIAADARLHGQLCCLVSDAANSQVLFPAMHQWGDVTVALHTNASSCRRAVAARDHLASLPLPPSVALTEGGRNGG